jgi:hypothetical protein
VYFLVCFTGVHFPSGRSFSLSSKKKIMSSRFNVDFTYLNIALETMFLYLGLVVADETEFR